MVHSDCRQYSDIDGVVVGYYYDEPVKGVVAAVKYRFYSDLFAVVAQLLGSKLQSEYSNLVACNPLLVPVPLGRRKQRWRGFNQAQILAKWIAAQLELESLELLRRVRETDTQVGQDRTHRLANLKDAFAIDFRYRGDLTRPILLVDDVYTTGATAEECAKVLKQAGYRSVYVVVIGRG